MEEYTRDEIEGMEKTTLDDLFHNTYGNATLNRYVDNKIFSTNISKEMVEGFIRLFNEISESDSDFIWYKLKTNLQEKLQLNREKTPVEEFLYALKLRSNCFGIEGKSIDPNKLEAYAKALNYLCEEGDKKVFYQVIKHTLVNWDWFQPLHVCIYLLGEHPELSDQELDEILCAKMLYRKSYWMTAFDALIKRVSLKNYQILMDFLMRGEVKDILTGAAFEVATRKKVDLFTSAVYGVRQSSIYDELYSRYVGTYMGKQSYKKRTRDAMDDLFPRVGGKDKVDWAKEAASYTKKTNSEKEKILQQFRFEFNLRNFENRDIIQDIFEPDFLDVIIKKSEKASANDQNWTYIMLAKNRTDLAHSYVRKKYKEKENKGIKNISLMSACYIADGKPTLKEIVDIFFISTSLPDTASVPIIKHAVSCKKSQGEFQDLIIDLIASRKSIQEKNDILTRLSLFYGTGQINISLYPVREMDAFLNEMLEKSLKSHDMASVNKILTVLSKVSDDLTKSRYEKMLVSICNGVNKNTNQFRLAKEILTRFHE